MRGHGITLTVNDSYGDGLQYGGVVGNYTLSMAMDRFWPK